MPSEARRPEDRSEPTAAGSTTGAEGADRWDTWRLYFETTARLTSRVEERLKAQGCSLMEYQLLLLLHEAPGR